MTTLHDIDIENLDDEDLLNLIHDLRYRLTEAESEIDRHHEDFQKVSVLAKAAYAALCAFDGDDPGLWVGDASHKVRQIRNIVG